ALARRGLELPAALLATGLTALTAPASASAAALQAVRGGASPGALALAGSPALLGTKPTAALLFASVLGLCFGAGAMWPAEAVPPAPGVQAPAEQPKTKPEPQPRVDHFGDALPEGAYARFGTTRFRQGFLVHRVLFAPDGKSLALAGCGRPVGLWDVATGKELKQFRKNNNQPSGIAFAPDGTLLAEGDADVRLWDTKTGALVRELPSGQQSQRAVVFSPDGKLVISGGHDTIIHLWNPATGAAAGKLEGHSDSVLALAISRDGAVLASAGAEKSIRLWDLATRTLIRELKGHQKYFTSLSFSRDGRSLAAANSDDGSLIVVDVATGKERLELGDEAKAVRTVSFSPDGKLLATGSRDGTIALWDADSGKKVRDWRGPFGVSSLDFDPDSKTLATVSAWECGPRLWNVADGAELPRPSEGHRGLISQLRLPPKGGTLLSLGRDQQLLSWDLQTGTAKALMQLPV